MVHRSGIIGCGAFAERGMGLALNAAADTKLVSVYSRSPDRARACATKYKAERA